MSADNFLLLRKDGERYVLTMEFASDDDVGPIPAAGGYASLDDAMRAAEAWLNDEVVEYGLHINLSEPEPVDSHECPECFAVHRRKAR